MSYFSLPQFFPGYSPLPDADISLEPFSNFDANQRDTTEQLRNTHSVRGGGLNLDSVASRLRMGVWDRIRGRQKACGIDEENGLSDVWPITPKPPEDILANTYDYYKAARNMGVVLRKSAFWGAALSIGYAGTNYILSQYPDNTFANGFLYVGLPALSIKPTYELLEGTYKALGKNARIFAIEALVQNHKKDKAYFAHLEKTISVPKYIKTAVDIAHKLIDEDLARFEKAKPEEILPEQLELTGRRRDWTNNFIIGRPMELKAVEKWKTEVGRAELDEEIDGALEHMHDADKEFIKTMADLVCLSSVEYVRCKSDVFDSQSLEQRMTLKNTELYRATGSNFILVGPPGVGKTYSVKQVLGKNLGAYIVGISIGIDEEGGFSIVLPKEWDVLRQTGFVPKPADVLGKAIEAQMEGQCQNVVLYFNELNARSPLTVDGFKRFLDRVEKFIKNTPLSTLYDITSVTVIIDLNPSKENNQFINCVPILDRTHIHYFQPKVKESLARLVLRKAFEEYSDPWCLPIKNNASVSRPHPPVLNAAKKEELTSVFNEVFETLVKEHMGPGTARTGFIERLVSNMARSLRHNKPLVKTEIENYIQAYYKEFSEAKANEDQSFLIHK